MRVVVLTRLQPQTPAFLAHLLSRGVEISGVVFEGAMNEGSRVGVLRVVESLFLWLERTLFLGKHPATWQGGFRRFASATTVLKEHGIPWVTVENHNDSTAAEALKGMRPDIAVLYGTRIIKQDILAIPAKGTLNIHSSLLPKFRGGKAEFWILFKKQPESFGITVHWVEPKLDAGPIVLQERIPVVTADTPATLRAKAQFLAPVVLTEALRRLTAGETLSTPQNESEVTTCKRPTADEVEEYKKAHPGQPVF